MKTPVFVVAWNDTAGTPAASLRDGNEGSVMPDLVDGGKSSIDTVFENSSNLRIERRQAGYPAASWFCAGLANWD
ncbi:MAG: hypothetical protein WB762_09785 [Candidatus Sulfotelmatobacter sp.]